MIAIIKTGGKQLLVKKNDVIFVEKIEGKVLFRFWPFSKFGGVK